MPLVPRVLFICCGNTCRSVFAKYIARHLFGNQAHFESAGLAPQAAADAARAIATLKAVYGIDASGHMPSNARYVGLSTWNVIIAFETNAEDELTIPAGQFEYWSVDDPWDRRDEAYAECSRVIEGSSGS